MKLKLQEKHDNVCWHKSQCNNYHIIERPISPYVLHCLCCKKLFSPWLIVFCGSEVSKSPGDYLTCAGEQAGHYITRGLPADSDLVTLFSCLPGNTSNSLLRSSWNSFKQVPEKRPELEAKASDSSATGGPNEINYAQLFEEELLKVYNNFPRTRFHSVASRVRARRRCWINRMGWSSKPCWM